MEQGDEAAFEYLRAEADGFHCTPYGHCITSFLVDRCPKHLQCFCGCKYLCATDLPETRSNLVQLRSKLQKTVETIEGRMLASQRTAKALSSGAPGASEALVLGRTQAERSIGKNTTKSAGSGNQLSHAKACLDGVEKLLKTPAGQLVFPEGEDLSGSAKTDKETVLDDKKKR